MSLCAHHRFDCVLLPAEHDIELDLLAVRSLQYLRASLIGTPGNWSLSTFCMHQPTHGHGLPALQRTPSL